jgi:acetylglutamate kinase
MTSVYIRMAFYLFAPIVAMVPGIAYDPVAQTVLLELDTIAYAVAAASAASGAVFWKWGNK